MSTESRDWGPGTNTGHGHVWPRPDGARMRCGGPGVCRACTADAATLAGRIGGGDAGAAAGGIAMPTAPAPDAPDAVARDAAALVDAAASAIQAVDVGIGAWRISREAGGRIAAAALAPALRELARRARGDGAGPGEWLHGLADALDARGTP